MSLSPWMHKALLQHRRQGGNPDGDRPRVYFNNGHSIPAPSGNTQDTQTMYTRVERYVDAHYSDWWFHSRIFCFLVWSHRYVYTVNSPSLSDRAAARLGICSSLISSGTSLSRLFPSPAKLRSRQMCRVFQIAPRDLWTFTDGHDMLLLLIFTVFHGYGLIRIDME